MKVHEKILYTVLILLCYTSNAQQTNPDYCEQFRLAIDYIKKDKNAKIRLFAVDTLLRNGWNYNMFSTEYIATKLNLNEQKVISDKSEKAKRLWQRLENNSSFYDGKAILCKDINTKRRKSNTIFSKLDDETLLVNLTTKRVGKEGSNGIAYLFFFDKKEIIKVLKSSWIE